MKFLIYFIIAGVILIFLAILFLHRKKVAIRRTKCSSEEEKLSYVNMALNPFGFEFDYCQDIVVSKMDSWQRDVGYTDLYYLKSQLLNMVMDSEPIFFEYDGKQYRIEFWKGQYGITTGAEVGVYVRDNCHYKKWEFYRAANECEFLNICFSLYKSCLLFSREDRTWWLTGFDVGEFSWPSELAMKVCINFPNRCMRNAFVEGLLKAGYTSNKIDCCENYVCFDYCRPLNYKLNHRKRLLKCFVQCINKINCSIYMFITRPFNRTLDKLTYLRFLAPCIYRLIIRLSVPRRKHKKYHKKLKKRTV